MFNRASDRTYQYANAVIAADAQFAAVLKVLENKGMLDNALVTVLSDHGEALGVPVTDTLLRGVVAREMNDGQRISHWSRHQCLVSTFAQVLPYGDTSRNYHSRASHEDPFPW